MNKFMLVFLSVMCLNYGVKGSLFDDVLEPVCALTMGLSSVPECFQELQESVKPFINQDGSVHELVYCCAMTTFRYCVTEKIGKTCGSNIESSVNTIINLAVQAIQLQDQSPSCRGNEIYFRKESPLCWAVWGHVAGGIALAVLLITVCCVCCKCCCKSKRQKESAIIVNLLSRQDGDANGGSNLNYRPLIENSSA